MKEWQELKSSINENREPIGSGLDGLKANKVIESIYKSSQKNKLISI